MLSTKFSITCLGMAFHSLWTSLSSSGRLEGLFLRLRILFFMTAQRFSIGFKSGLWAGQVSVRKPDFVRNAVATFDRCGKALSSWNQPSPSGNILLMVGKACLWSVLTWAVPVTDVRSGTSRPSLCHEKQPQCMTLGLCFTVAVTQSVDHFSSGSLHTLLLRFASNCENVASSLHNTFDQLFVVQCAYLWHQARRFAWFSVEMRGFFCATQFRNPVERSARPTVRTEISIPDFFFHSSCTPAVQSWWFCVLLVTNRLSCRC